MHPSKPPTLLRMLLLGCLLALASCGQTGDLYRPGEEPTSALPPIAPPVAVAAR